MRYFYTTILVLALIAGTINSALGKATPMRSDANYLQQKVLQLANNTKAVKEGKVLYRFPSTSKSFNYQAADPVQAWLDGYGLLTKEIENSLVGKVVVELPEIQKTGFQTKANAQIIDEDILPSVTVYPPSESELYFEPMLIWFQSIDDGPISTCQIYFYDFGFAAQPWWEIRSGKYDVVAFAVIYDGSVPYGVAVISKSFDLTPENSNIELSFEELKNEIQIEAYLPNGNPFPRQESADDYDYADCLGNLLVSNSSMGMDFFGTSEFHLLCNDLPDTASYNYTIKYASPEGDLYFVNGYIDGPFDQNIHKVLDPALYKEQSVNICLTQKDLDSPKLGTYGRLGVISPNACFEAPLGIVTGINPDGHVSVNTILPQNFNEIGDEDFYQTGLFLGCITDLNLGEPEAKLSGYMVENEDLLEVYPDQRALANKSIWYTNFPKQFVLNKPEKYFTYSLYSTGDVMVMQDWEDMDKVGDIQGSINIFGPMNESVEGINVWNHFTNLRVNGVETDINTLSGSPYVLGTLYEFDFVYDNVLVNESIETSNELTIGYVANDMWQGAPSFRFYQFRDKEGKLTNNIREAEGASLCIVGLNCQIETWIAPQDSDDWTLLESINPGEVEYYGKLMTYDLAQYDFNPNQWYKIKTCLTNEIGNFSRQTINYALYFDGTTGIYETTTTSALEFEYYDLCGRKVVNPSTGIYLKVSQRETEKPYIEKVIIR